MNEFLRLLLIAAVVIAAAFWAVFATRSSAVVHGQDSAPCWLDMRRVDSSIEDVQRIRVTGEAQEELLRQILVELKKRK